MDLQAFVHDALNQILAGIENAQKKNSNSRINPHWGESRPKLAEIEFDIAVTVEKTSQSGDEAKGKISVRTGFFDIGGGVGGDSQRAEANSTTSRIKFSVPVAFTTSGTEPAHQS